MTMGSFEFSGSRTLVAAAIAFALNTVAFGNNLREAMKKVGPGTFVPFYLAPGDNKERTVSAFLMDRVPVTNQDFFDFVTSNPSWQKANVSSMFADQQYLDHWSNLKSFNALNKEFWQKHAHQPVTNVSWFAARQYCKSVGKRLPTEVEWEFAALASADSWNGSSDTKWKQTILNWYATPSSTALADVGKGQANYWGIHDLHGLVWEWVEDFSNAVIELDSRNPGGDSDSIRFCGAGALMAKDSSDYATFMRFGFRSSLVGTYTTGTLGFRCASSITNESN